MSETKIYTLHESDEAFVLVPAAGAVIGSLAYAGATGFNGEVFGQITSQNAAYMHSLDQSNNIQSHIKSLEYARSQLQPNAQAGTLKQLDAKIAQQKSTLATVTQHHPADHTVEVIGECTAVPFVAAFTAAAIAQGIAYTSRKLGYRSGNYFARWHSRVKAV